MTGDTIIFRRGSSFEYQGQLKDWEGNPMSLEWITPDIYETQGFDMQEMEISVLDIPLGKFIVRLKRDEALKLPLGRTSWFKIRFQYPFSPSVVVFPKIWLDTR